MTAKGIDCGGRRLTADLTQMHFATIDADLWVVIIRRLLGTGSTHLWFK